MYSPEEGLGTRLYSPISTISLIPIEDWSEDEEDEIPAPPFSPCIYSSDDDDNDSVRLSQSPSLSTCTDNEDEDEEMEVGEESFECGKEVRNPMLVHTVSVENTTF